MLETKKVLEFIETNGKSSFEDIWKSISSSLEKISSSSGEEIDLNTIKADIYLSMIRDFKLIMTENNIWDLKSNYSLSEVSKIQNSYYENLETIEENDLDGFEKEQLIDSTIEKEDSIESSLDFEEDSDSVEFDLNK